MEFCNHKLIPKWQKRTRLKNFNKCYNLDRKNNPYQTILKNLHFFKIESGHYNVQAHLNFSVASVILIPRIKMILYSRRIRWQLTEFLKIVSVTLSEIIQLVSEGH